MERANAMKSENMKRILIVINSLSYGGIQRALLNLLHELADDRRYDVTLLLIRNKGPYRDQIPAGIRVMEANRFWALLETSNREIRMENKLLWLVRGMLATLMKTGHRKAVIRILALSQKSVGEYDAAISYRQPDIEREMPGGVNEFVLFCCKAAKKITFVHCDYLKYGGHGAYNDRLLSAFDRIAVVSKGCGSILLEALPNLKQKTHCVYNCHHYNEIRRLANVNTVLYNHEIPVFVTVCRLGPEKGVLRMLDVLESLVREGLRFCWHIVGDGEERTRIDKAIVDHGLGEYVRLEGPSLNPYRYMKDADFFLLTSIHEAAPMVIGEALCLGVPVISTRTSSADELIDRDVGIVCDNTSEAIYETLKMVFADNQHILVSLKNALRCRNNNNNVAMAQFYKLLEGI